MFWKIVWVLFGLIFIFILMHLFIFSSSRACRDCGIFQRRIEYQLPYTNITYKELSFEEDSLLSSYIKNKGWTTPHTHHWQFIHGSGNGIKCAAGDSSMNSLLNDPCKIKFIDAHLKYEGEPAAKEWIKYMMSKQHSRNFKLSFNLLEDYPENDFHNKDEFIKWKNRFLKTMNDLESNK